jgi:hypothetical protein
MLPAVINNNECSLQLLTIMKAFIIVNNCREHSLLLITAGSIHYC